MSVILGMNLVGLKKAVFPHPIIHKGGLQGRFDMGHYALIDVASDLFFGCSLDVKFFQNPVFDQGDPIFFRIDGIDQKLFNWGH